MKTKLTIPDLITTGVFTALYFVLVSAATFASVILLPGLNNVILPALCALLSGCVYMLLAGKLQKFGGISVMGIVMGLFFLISGHFITSFATNILMGIAADFVAWTGKYQNRKKLLASYILFSYGLFGPVLPLWFMKDAYITNLEARGKDSSYIADLFAIPSAWKAEQP
ncbi:MAG: MptD family putative ECF transporter S component [Hominisplanchenecus sp.]|nr:MptD family putative ECF transporter S component [Lachnospiraceae bacterium]MDY2818657.1 MptD family putative ECF transporter S component [Hominisplanchenecus sp.]